MLVSGKRLVGFRGGLHRISRSLRHGSFFSALLYRCKLNVDWTGLRRPTGRTAPIPLPINFPCRRI